MRWLWSFLAALAIVLGSFVLMLVMIFPPKSKVEESALQIGRFMPKLQQESSDPSRSRQQMPEKPVEPQPETPPTQQAPQPPRTPQMAALDLAVPQLSSNISINAAAAPSLQGLTAQAVVPTAPAAPAA
ncbi:MAG TPA: energy transducer TonB, partial [Pseudomonas sp.]|nr:energy transducer TonB [Pseudomonas sp.]